MVISWDMKDSCAVLTSFFKATNSSGEFDLGGEDPRFVYTRLPSTCTLLQNTVSRQELHQCRQRSYWYICGKGISCSGGHAI